MVLPGVPTRGKDADDVHADRSTMIRDTYVQVNEIMPATANNRN